MATDLENAQTILSGALAKLAACMSGDYSSALEFKPTFNAQNALDRAEYVRELRNTIVWAQLLINSVDCYELTSEMTT
jgi:hypothetical protein